MVKIGCGRCVGRYDAGKVDCVSRDIERRLGPGKAASCMDCGIGRSGNEGMPGVQGHEGIFWTDLRLR